MGDVAMTFTAEDRGVVAAMLLQEAKQEKLMANWRKMGTDSENAGETMKRALEKVSYSAEEADKAVQKVGMKKAAEAGTVAMDGLTSALQVTATAMAALGAASDKSIERAIERSGKLREQLEALWKTMGQTGEVSLLPEIRERLGSISSDTFSKKQIAGFFGDIHKIGKGELGTDVELGLTEKAVSAGRAGMDPQAFAQTAARLAMTTLKGGKLDDIADAATQVNKVIPGGLDESWEKGLSRRAVEGMDPYTVLRMITGLGRSGEGARGMTKIEEHLQKERKDPAAQAQIKTLKDQQDADEQTLKGIEDQKTALEEAPLTGGRSERERQRETRTAQVKALESQARGVRRAREDRGKEISTLDAKKAAGIGFATALEHPELLDDAGNAMARNLLAHVDKTEFWGGEFEAARTTAQDVEQSNTETGRRLRQVRTLRHVEVASENLMGSGLEMQKAIEVKKEELEMHARGGFWGMTYDTPGWGASYRMHAAARAPDAGLNAGTLTGREARPDQPVKVHLTKDDTQVGNPVVAPNRVAGADVHDDR